MRTLSCVSCQIERADRLVAMTKDELRKFLHGLEHKDDPLLRWERGMPQPKPPPRERKLDTKPREPDWSARNRWADERIQVALIEQQKFLLTIVAEAMGEYVAKECKAVKRELGDEVRQLRIEAVEAQTTISELRAILAAERGAIEMRSPLRARVN